MLSHATTKCHVCGHEKEEEPWGQSGNDPNWLICECCGCEYGYEDATPDSVLAHRQRWIDSGYQWHEPAERPSNWDCNSQMASIPPLPYGIASRADDREETT